MTTPKSEVPATSGQLATISLSGTGVPRELGRLAGQPALGSGNVENIAVEQRGMRLNLPRRVGARTRRGFDGRRTKKKRVQRDHLQDGAHALGRLGDHERTLQVGRVVVG